MSPTPAAEMTPVHLAAHQCAMSDSSIPNLPSQGEILLITDELSSPADFLLYRSFTAHLKSAEKSAKCVILSVAGNLPKWKSVAAKSVREILHNIDVMFTYGLSVEHQH